MLTIAKDKVQSENVQFQNADLTKEWSVQNEIADLVTFNLVLEHVEDLGFVFSQAYQKLRKGGKLFICELHPFKQYQGSKAKYETEMGIQTLDVFVHHTSEFVREAMENGFRLIELKEWFDQDNGLKIPRLISFVFEK
jgi:ubiquinone/menaquinone biosynthesis C-methylase UbiE